MAELNESGGKMMHRILDAASSARGCRKGACVYLNDLHGRAIFSSTGINLLPLAKFAFRQAQMK